MEKISPISTNLIQNYAQAQKVNTEPVKQVQATPEIASEIVKKETADATKAYAEIVMAKKTPFEKKSLDEIKSDLLAQGKVEGKDFRISKYEKSSFIDILENDRPVKMYSYGEDGNLRSIDNISYPTNNENGIIQRTASIDENGRLMYNSVVYDKDKAPYTNEIVNFETTPEQLSEQLKADGMKQDWDLEFIADDVYTRKITAFDPKSGKISKYEFHFCQDTYGKETTDYVSKLNLDGDGGIFSELRFEKDKTVYTEYNRGE